MSFSYNLAQFIAFRDLAECERVRAIKKEHITQHANPDFKISLIEDLGETNTDQASSVFCPFEIATHPVETIGNS